MYTIEITNLPKIDSKSLTKVLWDDIEKLLNKNIKKKNDDFTVLDI